MQRKARPQDGRPNATQGTSASWAPERNARHICKLRAPTQCKAIPQVGRPNASPQGKRKARPHVCKLGTPTQRKMVAQMQNSSATKTCTKGSTRLKDELGGRPFNTASPSLGAPTQRKARPQDGRPNATQGLSASWAPQRNKRHVRKLRSPTYVCKANARHVGMSANWAPQCNARHVRKMVAQTQNSSATKTSTQGSTRLKDELEDG
jgi:hypothetical protein